MKRTPPSLALWCLTRLSGQRGEAIVGDLLERFAEGEGAAWFWRQTLATVAFALAAKVRLHGLSFMGALASAAFVFFLMSQLDPLLTERILRFQTHTLFEWDPHWTTRPAWGITFLSLQVLQTGMWFAAAGWLATRIHRAHPRLIIVACAAVTLALCVPEFTRQLHNLAAHPRYGDAFKVFSARVLVSIGALALAGWWSARRTART